MNEDAVPTPDVEVAELAPETLKRRIDAGEALTLLDTRMRSDYEEWRIDGDSVDSIHVPYYEFLEETPDETVFEPIPTDNEVIVVCAEGGASEYVAAVLADHGYDVTHLEGGMEGWARINEAVEVEAYDGQGRVFQYHRPSSGCLTYLVTDGEEAAIVDPLHAFTDEYLDHADELGVELRYALDTHVHADHVSGVRALADRGVEGVVPAAAVDRGIAYADTMRTVGDGDTVEVGDVAIEAVYTPGHTTGMTSYLVDERFLATGDGLFVESVARPDLEEGDEGAAEATRMLYESLQERILSLPADTIVGGGHVSDAAEPGPDGTYTATLGTIVERMDVLSLDKSSFVEVVLADMPPRPANYEDIIATNLGQRPIDDEEAFRLELGPNNCAASQEPLATESD